MLHPSFYAYDSMTSMTAGNAIWFSRGFSLCKGKLPSRGTIWHFEDDFPIPKVGYVSSLEGNPLKMYFLLKMRVFHSRHPPVPSSRPSLLGGGSCGALMVGPAENVMKNLRPG